MAKRFTEVEKWKDPWFSNLTNDEKIIWLYLLDDCNHAGIWKVNLRRLNFECYTNVSLDDLRNLLGDRIVELSDEKWFIPKFVTFQYSNLNSKSKPILSVVDLLSKEGLIEEDSNSNKTLSIPFTNSMNTLNKELDKSKDTTKDKDKDKAKEMDMDKFQDKSMDKSKEQYQEMDEELWKWTKEVNY